MKKILFLTSNFPKFLDNGGKLRDYHIMKYLAQKHELWTVGFNESSLKKTETFLPFIPRERCFTIGATRDIDFYTLVNLRHMPLWGLIYYALELQHLLDELINKNHFNYIHVSHSYMAHYVQKYKNITRVIDHHNVKTDFYRDALSKTNNPIKRINYGAEYYKWFKYQREVLDHFEYHTACSLPEQKAIEAFVQAPVTLLPSGVDTSTFYPKKEKHVGFNLLFTGSLDYFPNEEAVIFFCQKILPIVRKAIPNVLFQVVGRKPSEALEKMIRHTPNTWFSCDVKDTRPFYYQSTLFVVPLLDGAGTRLKIMEAMATGLAVVSTTKGSAGLGLKDGDGILIADDPQEFAQKVILLLKNNELRSDLSQKAKSISQERFAWDKVLKPLDIIYT